MRGKISSLSLQELPQEILQQAPQGKRRASWLAGRVLLARIFSPLPPIIYTPHGKPQFADHPWWFNISHSGDEIMLVYSDQGEVGCDMEVIRPRANWRTLAEALFSAAEQLEIAQAAEEKQLALFWQIWTRKEALLKQAGGSAWQIDQLDSCAIPGVYLQQWVADGVSLAVAIEACCSPLKQTDPEP